MITKNGKTYSARFFYIGADGKKKSKYKSGFKTKAAAQAWFDEIQGITNGTAREDFQDITISQLFKEWITALETSSKKRSPATISFYNHQCKLLLNTLGNRRISDIRKAHIQAIINDLANSNIKTCRYKEPTKLRSASVRAAFRAMRALFNYAVQQDIIEKNPCTGIELPAKQSHEVTMYTGEQLRSLIDELKAQDHPIYFFVCFCVCLGLRRGEAAGVTWNDLDLDNGILNVQGNLIKIDNNIIYKTVKTEQSAAEVVLPNWLCDELKKYKSDRFVKGLVSLVPINIDNYISFEDLDARAFVCVDGNCLPFRPDSLQKRLNVFQRANGFPVSTLHDLRHVYGTLLIENGVDITTVSKALRHSSIKTTADIYVSPNTAIKAKATDAMSNILQYTSRPENCAKIVPVKNDKQK